MHPIAGGWLRPDYIPEVFSKKLLTYETDNTQFEKFVNRDYEGELKGAGDVVHIRTDLDDILTDKFVQGAPYVAHTYTTKTIDMKVERGRYFAFATNKLDFLKSDLGDWTNEWAKKGALKLALEKEVEWFESMHTEGAAYNQGADAGRVSGMYNLGTDVAPIHVTNNGKDLYTESGEFWCDAVKLVTYADAVQAERLDATAKKPFIVIPPMLAQRIRTSELFMAADFTGDSKTLLRQGLGAIGQIGEFDIFQSSHLYHFKNADGDIVWDCLFGDTRACTYADTITGTEVKDEPHVYGQMNHCSIDVYDWKVLRPQHLGHLKVTFDKLIGA